MTFYAGWICLVYHLDESLILNLDGRQDIDEQRVVASLEDADDTDAPPIGRTVVNDRELVIDIATQMVAITDDLEAVADRPTLGPETVYRKDVDKEAVDGVVLPCARVFRPRVRTRLASGSSRS